MLPPSRLAIIGADPARAPPKSSAAADLPVAIWKVAGECARDGVDHPRYLLRLAEHELIERERRMIDRLTHRVHILKMNGDSYRLRQSKGRRRKSVRSGNDIGVDAPQAA